MTETTYLFLGMLIGLGISYFLNSYIYHKNKNLNTKLKETQAEVIYYKSWVLPSLDEVVNILKKKR